jgi:hypothetical protein
VVHVIPVRPIGDVCSLDGQGRAARQGEFVDRLLPWLERWERTGRQAQFWFRPGSGVVESALRDLVRLEKACCPSLVLTVDTTEGRVRFAVEVPEGDEAALDGFTGMLDRP